MVNEHEKKENLCYKFFEQWWNSYVKQGKNPVN